MSDRITYVQALRASEKASWRVEDLINESTRMDFGRPFLPESLARADRLAFLGPDERRVLNQIRGAGYLAAFGLVEEFILPFVLDHARSRLGAEDHEIRALLQFAGEEAKHIHLFRRFRAAFERGFGTACPVIGPGEAVAREVLAKHPLAVALVILHIEWMTQRHFLDSVVEDTGLDPMFKSLLKHHWMEECQHARLDELMVDALAAACDESETAKALDDYLAIGGFLDAGLEQQARFDRESLEAAIGRTLPGADRDRFVEVQHQANRWTFLGSGMTHPRFTATLATLGAGARDRIAAVAPAFC